MLGFYRAVARLRAYFLRPVGSAAREKACWRWWQIPSRFARTEQARDEGRERKLPTVDSIARSTLGGGRKAHFGLLQKVYAKRATIRATIKIGNQRVMNRVQDGGLAAATGESHRAKNKTTDDYESAEEPRNISNYYRK